MAIPTTPNVPRPTIYNLLTDYARYGLTAAMANEIIASRFERRTGAHPEFIVCHIQDGATPGSLQYWANPSVQASSTVMIQKDGSILRIVPEEHGPWTNGDVQNPTAQATEILALGGNPNIWSLTIEAEGTPWDAKPQAQIDAIVWQIEDWLIRYPNILDHNVSILRHGWINSVTRANCPGAYFDTVIAAINTWLGSGTGGGPTVQYPDGWDESMCVALWPKFNPKGSVSKIWLANWPLGTETFHFKDEATGRETFMFTNGEIWRPKSGTAWQVRK